ncbi:GNAT family N-acetyltransferase [Kaistella rhinocerotis]|uniref:GNAT family N-acetyltransferase n=1 Tax=Kaistella rhinocerotis TaxID=3026437 RepID=UPI0031339067
MIIVTPAKQEDIQQIVDIHLMRFPHFFLSSLGSEFLITFYKAFLQKPGILLVLKEAGEIRGFAAGSRDNRGFFKQLLLNNFAGFLFSGVLILLTKPLALKRIVVNIGKKSSRNKFYAELLSIATLRNKKGYGKLLLEEFEKEIAGNNPANLPISLTTDFDDNDKAITFYKNAGYEVSEVFESYARRKMYRFTKRI